MGVGYTTTEAEDVINHPVRRRIILWLMTFGNAGIITGINELHARGEDWLVGRPLARLHLPDEGVVILGLQRHNGSFHGVPTGQTVIMAEDTVIAYGRLDHLQELDDRHKGRAGDLAHLEAVREQHEIIESVELAGEDDPN